jgi:hypothetical protein
MTTLRAGGPEITSALVRPEGNLRAGGPEVATALAGIEGVVLRDRSLRFAVLDQSRLYAADLIGAD